MFSFGADKQTARVAGEFYLNAINVMRGAEAISSVCADPGEREVPHRVLGAGGGQAAAAAGAQAAGRADRAGHRRRVRASAGRPRERLAAEGACVVVADRDGASAQTVAAALGSADVAVAVTADVTSEADVAAAFAAAALAFGGVDLVVNNAGLSISKPLAETTRGGLGPAARRDGARVVPGLAGGGQGHDRAGTWAATSSTSCSKNAVFAGPSNVAYGAAKADQAHQVRLLAAELGEHGIRVNGINPDGVVRGSGIFAGGWGASRAAVYGVPESELGAFYAKRTLLKREVLPEHVAAAVFALCGGDLPLTTGLLIPVDAGVAAAFLR